MFTGSDNAGLQAEAVRREYREALRDKNYSLALNIVQANPDLFPPEEATLIATYLQDRTARRDERLKRLAGPQGEAK